MRTLQWFGLVITLLGLIVYEVSGGSLARHYAKRHTDQSVRTYPWLASSAFTVVIIGLGAWLFLEVRGNLKAGAGVVPAVIAVSVLIVAATYAVIRPPSAVPAVE